MADARFTVPNVLSGLRLAAAFVLAGLAMAQMQTAFFWLLVAALLSDEVDGKIARWLHQRTDFGAKLDSVSDVSINIAVVVGAWFLKPDFLWRQAVWIALPAVSYAISCAYSGAKFGRMPAYHTVVAKTAWLLTAVGVVTVFAEGPAWPFQIAMAAATVANIEAVAITTLLKESRSDAGSLWQVIQRRRDAQLEALDHREGCGAPIDKAPENDINS